MSKAELFRVQTSNVIFCPKLELFRSDFGRSTKLDHLRYKKKVYIKRSNLATECCEVDKPNVKSPNASTTNQKFQCSAVFPFCGKTVATNVEIKCLKIAYLGFITLHPFFDGGTISPEPEVGEGLETKNKS